MIILLLINVKMPTIVGILAFMSKKKELSRLISKYRLIRKKILQGFDSADINDYKICSDGQSFVTQWA